ncbi:MAG: N-acetylglucosamine-6-phosphate deacetylase [Sporolactobacillus sp.]
MAMVISGCLIYANHHWIEKGTLTFENGIIQAIGSVPEVKAEKMYRFPESYRCIPGMIDMHIHGAGGADTMDATPQALRTMAELLPREATTAFLATTMTQSTAAVERALDNAARVVGKQKPGEAEMIGIHLEGPFINPSKAGAQPLRYIAAPSVTQFESFQQAARGLIKEVTVAPELAGASKLIQHLAAHHIVASIGHSDAIGTEMQEALSAGATQVTHLFNGMRGLHQREPGVLGSALMHHNLYAELICDGRHVCQEMVALAYRLKGSERMILITDAMRAKGLPEGTYDLGGQAVHVKNGLALLNSGTLAGSVLTMDQAMRNMMTYADAKLEDVIRMGAENPADQCGVKNRKGSLQVGKDADIVVLDAHNQPVLTLCRGAIGFERKE